MQNDSKQTEEGEILPPDTSEGVVPSGDNVFLTLASQYTERPDLFIDAIERHDPGFVKRMNERSEEFATESRIARYKFGRRQAYATLSLQIISALALLGIVGYSVWNGNSGFWTIIALVIFYAVSQGGTHGFLTIIEGLKNMMTRKNDEE